MLIRFDDSNSTTNIAALDQTEFNAYPNPFTDRLILSGVDEKAKIEILNVFGSVVTEQFVMNGEITLPSLAKGIYFLRIGNRVMRVVKS